MTVQSPRPPAPAELDIEAGVIEDARARQRRQRRSGLTLLAATAAAGVLILGLNGGGGGPTHPAAAGQSGAGPGGGAAHPSATRAFPEAPATQPNAGVETFTCPLAAANRYLPPWSGCVSARVVDLSGNGRPDLVLVYSRIGHHPIANSAMPTIPRRLVYPADQAMLRVVTAAGTTITTPIRGARAALFLSTSHLSAEPGKQLLLTTQWTSTGRSEVAFSLYRGRLVSAGAALSSGGDSAAALGFDCLRSPPRVIQRTYTLIHGRQVVRDMIYGLWRETILTYTWRGPRLVRTGEGTFKRLLLPNVRIGAGCTTG